jgi:hypothetical protein
MFMWNLEGEKTRDESRRRAVGEEKEDHVKGQEVKRGHVVNLMKVFYLHI